jgi:hypothetical protein
MLCVGATSAKAAVDGAATTAAVMPSRINDDLAIKPPCLLQNRKYLSIVATGDQNSKFLTINLIYNV